MKTQDKIYIPAEWSEEDEKMRNAILQDLANIKTAYPKINIQDEFDWLKSLRPQSHWKPSWEQIDTLDAVYKTHYLSPTDKSTILNLLNDLKKL